MDNREIATIFPFLFFRTLYSFPRFIGFWESGPPNRIHESANPAFFKDEGSIFILTLIFHFASKWTIHSWTVTQFFRFIHSLIPEFFRECLGTVLGPGSKKKKKSPFPQWIYFLAGRTGNKQINSTCSQGMKSKWEIKWVSCLERMLQGWDKGESEMRWMAEASGDVTSEHLDEVRVPAIWNSSGKHRRQKEQQVQRLFDGGPRGKCEAIMTGAEWRLDLVGHCKDFIFYSPLQWYTSEDESDIRLTGCCVENRLQGVNNVKLRRPIRRLLCSTAQ